MKKIAKLLRADLNGSSDLAAIAAMLAGKGRGNDTLLAHITPREAEILKAAGGSGTTNPETGLLEFFEGEGSYDIGFGADTYAPTNTSATSVGASPTNEQIISQYNLGDTGQGLKAPATAVDPYSAQGRGTTLPSDVAIEPTVSGATTSYISPYGTGLQPVSLTGRQDYGVAPTTLPRGPSLVAEGQAATPITTPPPPEKSPFGDLRTQDMVRLGLAGGLGLYGATQAKKGAQQAQQAAAEQKAVGAPYQAKGQELIRAAESGELTPTSQQQLQALQARLAQGAESRGGVGAAQVAAQAEAYRQQLLSQQYNLGLQVSNIGDQIALGAIRTGLQADQALNQASTNFYTNLAAIGAGIPITQTRTA
jgi:hypothetical protein